MTRSFLFDQGSAHAGIHDSNLDEVSPPTTTYNPFADGEFLTDDEAEELEAFHRDDDDRDEVPLNAEERLRFAAGER